MKITIDIPDEVLAQLQAQADRSGLTIDQLVERAIVEYLNATEPNRYSGNS